MYLIVGLGNPEVRYYKTFHNLGFLTAGDVAEKLGAKFKKTKCEAKICLTKSGHSDVLIARPLTYMNSSGRAVKGLMAAYHLLPSDLIVIYDDYDLPKGTIRIRKSGGPGTHNGMRSVVSEIGSTDFVRIRIGIRDDKIDVPILDYVLSEVREEDHETYLKACQSAAEAAVRISSGEALDLVMQDYNGQNLT
ncbi:MAG: aminoacyl-tRNA hydrolase [Clostridia bacterium]|nr:aminoacyl-tRNA hydrolase [Clostridia bacterium]